MQEKFPWWFYIDWVFVIWLAVPMALLVEYIIIVLTRDFIPYRLDVSLYLVLVVLQGLIAGIRTQRSLFDLIERSVGHGWWLMYVAIFLLAGVYDVVLGEGDLLVMGEQVLIGVFFLHFLVKGLIMGFLLAGLQGLLLKPHRDTLADLHYGSKSLAVATVVGFMAVQFSNSILLFMFWVISTHT